MSVLSIVKNAKKNTDIPCKEMLRHGTLQCTAYTRESGSKLSTFSGHSSVSFAGSNSLSAMYSIAYEHARVTTLRLLYFNDFTRAALNTSI